MGLIANTTTRSTPTCESERVYTHVVVTVQSVLGSECSKTVEPLDAGCFVTHTDSTSLARLLRSIHSSYTYTALKISSFCCGPAATCATTKLSLLSMRSSFPQSS